MLVINIEIQNLTTRKIDEAFTKKVIHTAIQLEKMTKNGRISVDVAFVGRGRMQVINRNYNGRNRATDILSFSGGADFIMPKSCGEYLGEIILCPAMIQKQASRTMVSFKEEFTHVLIHGTLHLLGWEHEGDHAAQKKMHAYEEKIIAEVL